MAFWILKSEPKTYSVEDLANELNQTTQWEGIRNYQARNHIRSMQVGDQGLFYHSSCAKPAAVGIVEIVKAAYPDPTSFDPDSRYFDSKSDPADPRWYLVDVRLRRHLKRPITLEAMKKLEGLDGLALIRRGNRLSVMPVAENHWDTILAQESAA